MTQNKFWAVIPRASTKSLCCQSDSWFSEEKECRMFTSWQTLFSALILLMPQDSVTLFSSLMAILGAQGNNAQWGTITPLNQRERGKFCSILTRFRDARSQCLFVLQIAFRCRRSRRWDTKQDICPLRTSAFAFGAFDWPSRYTVERCSLVEAQWRLQWTLAWDNSHAQTHVSSLCTVCQSRIAEKDLLTLDMFAFSTMNGVFKDKSLCSRNIKTVAKAKA